jgi:hypothetical protein
MMAGERCGDHLVAAYLAKVNAMKRQSPCCQRPEPASIWMYYDASPLNQADATRLSVR